MTLDSVSLTNEVVDRMKDIPSHTVVSMHHIIKETLAVLVEYGYIAYDQPEPEVPT